MRMRKRRKRKRSKRRSSQNKREDSDRKDEWGYAVSPLVPRCSARGCRVQGLSILLCSVPRGSDDHSRIHWETACAVSSVYVGCVNVQLVCSADVTRTEREHINITKLKLYLECDNYPLSFYPPLPLPLPLPPSPLLTLRELLYHCDLLHRHIVPETPETTPYRMKSTDI